MELTMNQMVADFTQHLRLAMQIAQKTSISAQKTPQNVLICGMGGSGIGGTIMAQLLADHCTVPILSSKDYSIPAFVNENTLVIASSYSGNTEETLEALESAIAQGASIACISSGGRLSEMAIENGWPLISVPGGLPPRAAFGLTFPQLFRLAEAYGLTLDAWHYELSKAIELIDLLEEKTIAATRSLAETIQHKLPIIYSSTWLEGVATRWQQQIAENSKGLSWHNTYPEMNHNELVGWAQGNHDLAVLFLHGSSDHPRVTHRMMLSEEVVSKKTPHIHHISAQGGSRLEQALYLIHFGDWMTVHLSALRGADSIEIEVINWLKDSLAKF